MKKAVIILICIIAFASTAHSTVQTKKGNVQKWGIYTIELNGPSVDNPFTDVQFSAVFKKDQKEIKVPGFYDGEGRYIIRFSPDETGEWVYKTQSNVSSLTGKTGKLNCVSPEEGNHGPVKVANTYYFNYADGTPYFCVGTTCYQWISQPKELQDQTMKTLAIAPFNKIRMCIFPKWYIYNRTEPTSAAYVNITDSTFDFAKFNPVFWQNLENRIVELGKLGIQADIVLFHPYDKWGFATMTKEQDDRYIRYAIARLSAYQNVWWALANEFDFMTIPPRAGHAGNKDVEDWDRFFSILQNEDPYHRLRSIHNGSKWYDHTKSWVTHASIQSSKLDTGIVLREKYKKPVVFDECRYEGNIETGWGQLTAKQMTERFWWGNMNGCYVGHGETVKAPEDILWWAKGGVLRGESPARIAYFRKIMETLPFAEMTPVRQGTDVYVLSKPGQVYMVYALKGGPIRINLAGKREYNVELIDTWNMKAEKLDPAKPGEYNFNVPEGGFLIRFTVK